jgi:spore coat polysaccharide biosynthesis protein SpsF
MILAVLQARCSSTRLPGKVLAEVHGAPMILRQVERVRRARTIDELVVATSVDPSDDPLVDTLREAGVQVRRGPLADVASRFALVINEFEPDSFVRLTADCPLADHEVIDEVVRAHIEGGADYTSNVIRRTFPQGLDTECVRVPAFRAMLARELDMAEREHVTLGLYSRPDDYSLGSVTQAEDHSRLRWTVDLPADLKFVRAMYDALYDADPDFRQPQLLRYLAEHPALNHTN